MHDPSFLALELRAPIPMYSRWKTRMRREHPRSYRFVSRRTNADNLGERTYPWWQLQGYTPRLGRWVFEFPTIIEVWHDEPGDADMGEVCNYRIRHERPIRWLWEHRAHLRWKVIPYIRVRRWLFDRCEDCGRRFRWREARFGTGWDAPGVLHDRCHQLRTRDSQIVDLVRVVRGIADKTTAWRVRDSWIDNLPDYWRPRVERELLTVDKLLGSESPASDQEERRG